MFAAVISCVIYAVRIRWSKMCVIVFIICKKKKKTFSIYILHSSWDGNYLSSGGGINQPVVSVCAYINPFQTALVCISHLLNLTLWASHNISYSHGLWGPYFVQAYAGLHFEIWAVIFICCCGGFISSQTEEYPSAESHLLEQTVSSCGRVSFQTFVGIIFEN